MKHKTLLVTFAAAVAFTVGCDNKTETTSQQLDKVQEKTAEAAADLKEKDYAYAQKTEYTEKMKGQLAEINRELDTLEAKIEKSSDAVKAEAKPKLAALRQQTDELSKKLDDVKNATESTWDNVKTTSKKAFADLKDGFTKARQWVSEKIAP